MSGNLTQALGSMTNILDTLYKICLHPRPDDELINRFSKVIDVYSIAEKSELVDSLARFIAEKFLSGEGSFEETDVAINNLAGYAICNNRIPEFMWGCTWRLMMLNFDQTVNSAYLPISAMR